MSVVVTADKSAKSKEWYKKSTKTDKSDKESKEKK